MTKIQAALDRIAARRPRIIDLSLDRVFSALEALGNPHRRLPPVFHVAGTNGKGSTIAFLRAMLTASGKSVHVYTSPHLVRFNERIVLNGDEITDNALIAALNAVDEAVGDEKLTYFETITCAAFSVFAQAPADFLLLEVGLGGRLDATNVLEKPLAAIAAPVDMDHQAFLGDSIIEIAAEKAGIFRRGAPAVIGRQSEDAMATLLHHANDIGARSYAMGRDWDAYLERGRLVFQDDAGLLDLDAPRLPGLHQADNAGLAIAALRASGVAIDQQEKSRGVTTALWPGRLQRLTRGPLIELARDILGEDPEIWLDGGHNPHAARAVAAAMADMETRAPRPLALIAGMQANKDAHGFFENFSGLAQAAYIVAADHENAAPVKDITEAAEKSGVTAHPCASLLDAMRAACSNGGAAPRILICGSLYLAGNVLRENA